MKKHLLSPGLMFALALICLPLASAQNGLPTAQPKHLTIIREQVKVGHAAEHARNEAGWPAALEKAKNPDYYLALTSVTGPTEAWYLIPSESYTAEAASMKRDAKDPVLSAEVDRLTLRDADFISGSTTVQTVARPDLSLGKFPTIAKVRFYEISLFYARPGQEEKLESLMKMYGTVRQRVAPESSYRVYSVVAGMVDSTYIIISSVEDYADFDRLMAEGEKVFASATPAEKAVFDTWGECVVKSETNRFRVDPVQSYVSKEVRASDPDFWISK